MELLHRTRCNICEQVFCCPDHRRKHEVNTHGHQRYRATQKVKPYRHIESYALEMRKSFLYLEDKSTTIDKYGRKRKFVNITKTLIENTGSQLHFPERKILVPVSRRKQTITKQPAPKQDVIALEDVISPNQAADTRDMVDELISPVESALKNDAAMTFVSPSEENLPDKVFTTSTPILEHGHLILLGINSTPLQSAKKSALRTNRGLNYMKRKVTFQSVESLYTTAKEESFTGNGILTTVANAFQTAIYTIAGISEGDSEEKAVGPEWSSSTVKRVQVLPQVLPSEELTRAIQGRRPLRTDKPAFRARHFH